MNDVETSKPFRTTLSIALLLLLIAGTSARAQSLTYLVGADAATCDFDNIQAAIDAAQAHAGPDTVRIARNLTYTAQALKVGAQELTLEGGYDTCASAAPASPSAKTTLSGAGGAADSVIMFSSFGPRTLRGLRIVDGDDPVSGGGIQVDSQGLTTHLFLENVEVFGNESAFGAGINFHGSGANASTITLGENVVVLNNIASESGGGIRVTGSARLDMVVERVAISGNEAQGLSSNQSGHGGGILIVGPATANIASPGFAGTAISGNFAKYGGGVAVLAPDEPSEASLLYSVDAARPLRIAANSASLQGGGLYLGGKNGSLLDMVSACVIAFDLLIEDNTAPVGAAVALNEAAGFILNRSGLPLFPCPGRSRPATAIPCSADAPLVCSRIAGNRSEDGGGQPGNGAVVSMREGVRSTVFLAGASITGNAGGELLRGATCTDCLLAGNVVSGSLAVFPFDEDSDYVLDESTIAGNTIGGAVVLRVGDALALKNSIVQQPGKDVFLLDGGDASVDAANLLVSSCGLISCTAFPNVTAAASGPRFVDPERGDFRLQAASVAVDFAAARTGEDLDVIGAARSRDLDPKPDLAGARDLGAYERQQLSPLVLNGDFAQDFRLWSTVAPATVVHQASPGAGSVRISDDANVSASEVIGLRQCVPLPGPGFYAFSGLAVGDGLLSTSRDRPRIRWRYFAQTTSNDCTGTPIRSGELSFPNGSSLSPPLNTAVIAAAVGEFNERTQVEIELVAVEGSLGVNDSTGATFDAIRLVATSLTDTLFADGFE